MDLLHAVILAGSLVMATASPYGCADGSTETLVTENWLSGCAGSWSGHIYNASHLCGDGWRVCSWEDHRMLRKLKWDRAQSIEGCFAYNAAQDGGTCGPCANHIDQDDMAGVGKDCPHHVENERSCLGQGVISSSCCQDSSSNQACSYSPEITGVLCCKVPEKPPVITQRFPTKLKVTPGQNWTLNCPAIGSPNPTVNWLKNGRTLHQSHRITIERETLRIQNVAAGDAASKEIDVGCMDGTVDGLAHLKDVAACGGSWKGHVSKGKVHCSPGWRVCSHEDWILLKAVSWFDATGINGCYAYDAAVNGGKCSSCLEGSTQSMGGIGRHCSKRRRRQSSCIAEGRIDVYDPLREGGHPSCNYQEGLISGVLCCRIPIPKRSTSGRRKKPSKPAVCDPPCQSGSYCLEPGVCACEPGREAKCALREEAVAISLAKLERKCLRHCRNGGQCFQGHCFCPANTKGRFCQKVL